VSHLLGVDDGDDDDMNIPPSYEEVTADRSSIESLEVLERLPAFVRTALI